MRLKKFIEKNKPREKERLSKKLSLPTLRRIIAGCGFEVCGGRGQWCHLGGRNTRAPPGKRQSARRRLDDSLDGSARAFERRRCILRCVRVFSHGFALKRYERASSVCHVDLRCAEDTWSDLGTPDGDIDDGDEEVSAAFPCVQLCDSRNGNRRPANQRDPSYRATQKYLRRVSIVRNNESYAEAVLFAESISERGETIFPRVFISHRDEMIMTLITADDINT